MSGMGAKRMLGQIGESLSTASEGRPAPFPDGLVTGSCVIKVDLSVSDLTGITNMVSSYQGEATMPEDDVSYFERRAAEERQAALKASSAAATAAHRMLADRYASEAHTNRQRLQSGWDHATETTQDPFSNRC